MIQYKAKATSTNFNNAFVSRTEDTSLEGVLTIENATVTSSPDDGALVVAGGVGVGGDVRVQGTIYQNGVAVSTGATGTNTGDVTFTNIGTTPSPKGATIVGQVITLQPADLLNPGLMTTGAQSLAGIKTFQDKAFFQGGIEVTGPSTIINATELEVKDAYLTLNKGGTNITAENAGVEIERATDGNGAIQFDSSLASKWKLGIVGALYEVIVASGTQVIGGLKSFTSLLTTSDILLSGKLLKGVQTNTQSGTSISLTNPTKPVVLVTNAALVSIYDIAIPASNSQSFVLMNRTGTTITLLNGTHSGGIITGVDANLAVLDGRSVYLVFDSAASVWRVIGGASDTKIPKSVVTTKGDLIVGTASGVVSRFGAGTDGYVLTSDSTLTEGLKWSVMSAGSSLLGVTSKNAAYTITNSDDLVTANATSAAFTLTLPTAVGNSGRQFRIKKTDTSFNAVTVATTSSQTIDGATTTTVNTLNEVITVVSDGANWQVLERRIDGRSTAWTPSFAGMGTPTNVNLAWVRIGNKLRALGSITTGTVSGTTASLSLPSGLTIDTSVNNAVSTNQIVGYYARDSVSTVVGTIIGTAGGTVVNFSYYGGGAFGPNVATVGSNCFGSNEKVNMWFEVPITGWKG